MRGITIAVAWLVILAVPAVTFARPPLYLYDNFDGTPAQYTTDAWQIDQLGDGAVDLTGSDAILDLSYEDPDPNTLHHCWIEAVQLPLVFSARNQEFRFTFDIERIHDDWDGWVSGIAIGNDSSALLYGGLWGRAMDTRNFGAGFNTMWLHKKDYPGPFVRYHVDLTIKLVWVGSPGAAINATYNYWRHDPAYDHDPELYYSDPMISGVTVGLGTYFPRDVPIKVNFFNNNIFSSDSGGHQRMKLAIDNVYTSFDVGAEAVAAQCDPVPTADFNYDCKVDLFDFAILADEWLDCDLDPVSACSN